ncbi:MAG: VPLPA-CTERM-specific exosortase XrtD [Nitrospira sp. CR1.3]|nr:VPLPA-CTERM-specific exosortase XrtD [Nitrospira sp. CR1.3]
MGQTHEMNFPAPPLTNASSGAADSSGQQRPKRLPDTVMWSAIGTVSALLIGIAYAHSLAYLVQQWIENDNFSYGFFIPVISVALIWWKREAIRAAGIVPSWWGIVVLAIGMGLFVVGELATLYAIMHLSLWFVIVGLALAALGPRATWAVAFPLGYLLTMFPLPQMLQQNLSASLQLLSSSFGVGCLQLIGVTAFREGNVIDLGPIQLQVVEACSGLRYLFPLVSLALLCAYLFQDRMWKRAVLVVSAVPLAILLNGVRIGAIGVLVEWYGQGAAVGFMHFFEGWVVFVVSLAVLYGEMRLLARVGESREMSRPLVERSAPAGEDMPARLPASFAVCLFLLAGMALLSYPLQGRQDIVPSRQSFLDFPMDISGWRGTPMTMERVYVDTLRFDDYLLADFQAPAGGAVNLYVAYYRSQKSGQSAHSPKTCLPGGGWEMTSMTEVPVIEQETGHAFHANRVVIQKGDARQIVLYWFKQRERLVTNEYLVKGWLLWDSLMKRRSDGALIRLVAPLLPGEDDQAADRRLRQFASLVKPAMSAYVPD